MTKPLTFRFLSGIILIASVVYACSKGGSDTPPDPCAGVTVSVNATVTNTSAAGVNDGSITISATGGSGFTYKLGSGTFQNGNIFAGLAAGSYTVTAKNANGCTGSATFTVSSPVNSCTGVTITVTNTFTGNTPCQSANGSITVTASGGTGPYLFSLNNGVFQASNVFMNLGPGSYTVQAKDANNCTGTSAPGNVVNQSAGPLFSEVKNVISNFCLSCHNNVQQEGGMNWAVDCNIVNFRDRILARAVNANPSAMPPTGLIPAAERQKIQNWINAGGKFTD